MKRITEILKENTKLLCVHRTLDMLCIDLVKFISDNELQLYTFHIQSFYRFFHNEELLLGKSDLYSPSSCIKHQNDELFWSAYFDSDSDLYFNNLGNTMMDDIIASRLRHLRVAVEKLEISDIGDLRISFSDGYRLESYIDKSDTEGGSDSANECWRFFRIDIGEPDKTKGPWPCIVQGAGGAVYG